jgi:hypothetical protein
MLSRVSLLLACAAAVGMAQPANIPPEAANWLVPPDPDRALSAPEARRLVAQVVVLLDKRAGWGKRSEAVEELAGRIRHPAAAPAFHFVMLDESDDPAMRIEAARRGLSLGMSQTMGHAIGLLRSKDADVRSNVWELLVGQYPPGRDFGFMRAGSLEENEAATKRWEAWWEANKDTFKVNVWEAMIIH